MRRNPAARARAQPARRSPRTCRAPLRRWPQGPRRAGRPGYKRPVRRGPVRSRRPIRAGSRRPSAPPPGRRRRRRPPAGPRARRARGRAAALRGSRTTTAAQPCETASSASSAVRIPFTITGSCAVSWSHLEVTPRQPRVDQLGGRGRRQCAEVTELRAVDAHAVVRIEREAGPRSRSRRPSFGRSTVKTIGSTRPRGPGRGSIS